jgi:hypothetical protein
MKDKEIPSRTSLCCANFRVGVICMSSQQSTATRHGHKIPRSLILVLVLLTPTVFMGQSYRGSIRGKVLDPNGDVIAGAKVEAANKATGLQRSTVTGSDGGYVLAELPAGDYAVTAESAGLSLVAQNVEVSVGLDTTADFNLTKL